MVAGLSAGILVARLRDEGCEQIRSVDVKPFDQWYQVFDDVENVEADLKLRDECQRRPAAAPSEVYNLAADMGGMGFIENNKALCMLSVLINTHLLQAAHDAKVDRFFYASQRLRLQRRQAEAAKTSSPLKEADAYPAMPEDGYGWEKLFSRADVPPLPRRLRPRRRAWPASTTSTARTAPGTAAAKRRRPRSAARSSTPWKPATHEIEIWGDGKQTRSFMYIDDCVEGILKITHSDIVEPINLGSDELTTINGLVDMVEEIAGVKLEHKHNLNAPKGVNGRNSDNTLIKKYLGWAPGIRLRDGMERTYRWIYEEYQKVHRGETVRT